jgi:hypothetical protein
MHVPHPLLSVLLLLLPMLQLVLLLVLLPMLQLVPLLLPYLAAHHLTPMPLLQPPPAVGDMHTAIQCPLLLLLLHMTAVHLWATGLHLEEH